MKNKPIDYAVNVCDALIKRYKAKNLPPKGTFFYHQGVALSGMQQIYLLTGDERYFKYIKDYVDSVTGKNGEIYGFEHELNTPKTPWLTWNALTMLDHKQPVILLYNLYDKTKDEKYLNAIKTITESMYFWPVNQYGGYWHMMTQPYQMWMDGAYMAGPLSVMYAQRFGDNKLRERAINQIFIMNEHMKDEKTGLYYHGWDDSKKESWADKKTGLSGQFWGRAVGWYAVAILDILDYIPEDHPAVERLKSIEIDLLKSLVKYQDKKTGMWFNVIDRIDDPKNWVESSCTNLFIYSYAKAIRKGIIGNEYKSVLFKAYEGIENALFYDDNGDVVVDNVCVGTCIESGTYEHYLNRDRISNDLHGIGAFLLMCAEMQRYLDVFNS